MRILVTGGAGFVGSELVKVLAKNKENIICVFDCFTHGFPTKVYTRKNIQQSVVGDVRNYYDISRALERFEPDTVIHLAAYNNRPEAIDNFRKCAETNYVGTANLLEACTSMGDRKPKKIIFSSSETVNDPLSHYGISKRAAANLLNSIAPRAGIKCWVLEFVEIYGHSKPFTSKSQVNWLVENMLRGNNLAVDGPNACREFIHLSDVLLAIQLSLKSDINYAQPLAIGTGAPIRTRDLVTKVKSLLKYEGTIKYLERPGVPIFDNHTDLRQAEELIGFKCEKDFDEGLKELIQKRKKEIK